MRGAEHPGLVGVRSLTRLLVPLLEALGCFQVWSCRWGGRGVGLGSEGVRLNSRAQPGGGVGHFAFLEAALGTAGLQRSWGDGWPSLALKLAGFWMVKTRAAVPGGSGKPGSCRKAAGVIHVSEPAAEIPW